MENILFLNALKWIGNTDIRGIVVLTFRCVIYLISDLERDFADLLHAQHLVHRPVVGAIQSHLADPDPPKALVLSFHGPTGVGKNFVSNIIADNLFERKRGSEFVHVIIGPHHFPHSFSQGLYSVSSERTVIFIVYLLHLAWIALYGLLPDTQNCGLCMRRECRERFSRQRLQRKWLVSDPGMHHDTCVTHVPWCMSRSLTRDAGENVPGIPGACATRNFAYLVRGTWFVLWLFETVWSPWLWFASQRQRPGYCSMILCVVNVITDNYEKLLDKHVLCYSGHKAGGKLHPDKYRGTISLPIFNQIFFVYHRQALNSSMMHLLRLICMCV